MASVPGTSPAKFAAFLRDVADRIERGDLVPDVMTYTSNMRGVSCDEDSGWRNLVLSLMDDKKRPIGDAEVGSAVR